MVKQVPKRKTKTDFIGIKVSSEQSQLLEKLRDISQAHSKTDVLLQGLGLLAECYSLPGDSFRQGTPGEFLLERAHSSTLRPTRQEIDSWRYAGALNRIKDSIEEVIKQVVRELGNTESTKDNNGIDQAALARTLVRAKGQRPWLSRSILTGASNRLGITVGQINQVLGAISQGLEELGSIDEIIDSYHGDKSALIQILLHVQRERHWLPGGVLMYISERLDIPLSQIYQIATFYTALSITPRGRHCVSVCTGTACHVRGSPRLLDRVVSELRIGPGQTTPDQKFSLTTVNCLGCCALGPVLTVDGEYYSNPSPKEMEGILASCA